MDRISLGKERRPPDYYSMHAPATEQLAAVLFAYALADLIAAFIVHGKPSSEAAGVFVTCVIGSQAILLCTWLGLGNPPLLVRLILAIAALLPVLGIFATEGELDREFLAGTVLLLLAAAAPYGFLKLLGFRLVRYDYVLRQMVERGARPPVEPYFPQLGHWEWQRIQPPIKSAPGGGALAENALDESALGNRSTLAGRAPVQFSIVQIFGWMILAGVMATLARLAEFPLDAVWPMTVAISIFTAFGLVTLWAVLGGEIVGPRLLAPFVLAFFTALMMSAFIRAGEAFGYVFVTLFITTSLVALVLGVFRSAGYRVRRAAKTPGDATDYDNSKRPSAAADPWNEEDN